MNNNHPTNTYLSLEHIKPALQAGALVLVPNNRLRNHLIRAYALEQTQAVWSKPDIQSLGDWLGGLWRQLREIGYAPASQRIASRLELQILWEKIITQSPQGAALLRPQALAEQADSARQSLELWQISDAEFRSHLPAQAFSDTTQNAALFLQWLQEFRANLKNQGAVTRETSFDQIARALRDEVILQAQPIFLEGFDELPPLVNQLLDQTKVSVTHLPEQSRPNPQLQRTLLKTTDDEVRAAALWAKKILQQHFSSEENSQPEKNLSQKNNPLIGVVVPNLGQVRAKVERIFNEVFIADSLLPWNARYTLPFNFSAGIPLGSTPIIQHLFVLLKLRSKNYPLEQICELLQSPFWRIKSDEKNKISFDELDTLKIEVIAQLRKLQHLHISLGDVIFCARRAEEKQQLTHYPLSSLFENFSQFLREKKINSLLPSDWLDYFDQCLTQFNWPGDRRLDSQEFQQLKQFQQVRDQFSQIQQSINFNQAIEYLSYLADRTPFQAQTPDSPIQILGALEAAGLQFSHLWVLGLSDDQWPAPASPNPLIPIKLQTQHKMPHANAARELLIATQLTERYKKSADQIIFSSAQHNLDNKANAELLLRVSTLIRDIPLTESKDLIASLESPLQIFYHSLIEKKSVEIIDDSYGPALTPDSLTSNEKIRGGSRLIEDQAKCPLVAFARWRLGAENPPEPQYGFSNIERGNLVHDCLASVWRELKNSQQLKSMEPSALIELVNNKAKMSVQRLQNRNPHHIGVRYAVLETQRLSDLILQWLELEKSRPDFEVIAVEEEREIILTTLQLKLRIDRIDQFNNGEQFIIDYKTGKINLKHVLESRPTQPQLALYALAKKIDGSQDDSIQAVAFGKISRTEQEMIGVGDLHGDASAQNGILSVQKNQEQQNTEQENAWQMQKEQWRNSLLALAEEFCTGHAEYYFYSKDAEKQVSDLKPFLRTQNEVDEDA